MKVLATLLWLEHKRAAWVVYAGLVAIALFALLLQSLPAVVTGLDLLGLPTAAGEQAPGAQGAGHSSLEIARETRDGNAESFSWSFSRSWGGGDASDREIDPGLDDRPEQQPSVVQVPIADELQVAFRPRQAVTVVSAVGIGLLMLLGFLLAHYREADRREMVLLYQSPVSGHSQLALRFLYMAGLASLAFFAVLAIYWLVQTSQSLSPLMPIVEAMGSRVTIHWGNLGLAMLTTQILPGAAFVLLYIQMQNAYDLLGGQRLVGLVLTLAALKLSASALAWTALAPEPSRALFRIVSVERDPSLVAWASEVDLGRYRIDLPIEIVGLGVGLCVLMLILSGRIWREVEWS